MTKPAAKGIGKGKADAKVALKTKQWEDTVVTKHEVWKTYSNIKKNVNVAKKNVENVNKNLKVAEKKVITLSK